MNFVTIDIDERIQFDRAKLLDVIHYVCAKVPTAELGRIKLQLDEQYGVARTTLQRMHARQIDGDLDGGRGLNNLQGS